MTDTTTTASAPTVLPTPAPTSAEAPRPIEQPRALSLVSILLSASAIVTGMGLLGIGGIVAGFVARRDEPAHGTLSTWGIVLGFVALFGWVIFAIVGVAALVPFWLSGALGG